MGELTVHTLSRKRSGGKGAADSAKSLGRACQKRVAELDH